MSSSHHGVSEEAQRSMKRFNDALDGIAKREWPDGRIGKDDDGSVSFALATDMQHRCIRMVFPKPVGWIGLDVTVAEQLRDELTERLLELKGITA